MTENSLMSEEEPPASCVTDVEDDASLNHTSDDDEKLKMRKLKKFHNIDAIDKAEEKEAKLKMHTLEKSDNTKAMDATNDASSESNNSDDDISDFRVKPKKKHKKGIIYISNIPKHMNVTRIREILGEFGKIGRVYLQPEKLPGGNTQDKKKKKKRKPFARHFTEGWIEFESKSIAKQIVPLLNNKQISSSKRSQFYDHLWSMKYLPRFKWVHLTERMNYEQAVHKQRLLTEVSQARKETTFFQNNLDLSEHIKKKTKKMKKETANATAAAAAEAKTDN